MKRKYALLALPGEHPECDFCSSQDVLWEYPTRDFVISIVEPTRFLSLGGWCACQKCYELIEAEDTRGLKKHMVVQLGFDMTRDIAVSAVLSRNIQGFFKNRTGPARRRAGAADAKKLRRRRAGAADAKKLRRIA